MVSDFEICKNNKKLFRVRGKFFVGYFKIALFLMISVQLISMIVILPVLDLLHELRMLLSPPHFNHYYIITNDEKVRHVLPFSMWLLIM